MIHEHHVGYRFCPSCGGPLSERILKAGDPLRLVCQRCAFVFYLDPKVAVGTIIRMPEAGVLLLRRAIDPGYRRWVFPGGYVDRGEQVELAALREAREECGLTIRLDGLVNVYSYPGRVPVIIVYAATWLAGSVELDDESFEGAWFREADIPWDDLAFRSTGEALRDYFAGRVSPHTRPVPSG